MVLIPPPYHPTCTLQPLCPSAHLIYWSCGYSFLNGVLEPRDVLLHGTQSWRLQVLLHGVPLPYLQPDTPYRLPHDPLSNAVMKTFQNLHYTFRDDPDLTPVKQYRQHHFLLKYIPSPHCNPRLEQHPQHHSPETLHPS